MPTDENVKISKEINDEVQEQSVNTLRTLSLGSLVNALSLTMLNNTSNQYASQTLANTAMVSTCEKILSS
ncbi:hypothetical protein [Spartinivicinus poritis]|uniref:Uncharacterized protein n=1 Tax=Spartinivicinus poritis TaxID=2994640 RepID=A0ABT5U736_9GAMM|nr:hypothetical protein [Spartinivicinus sp. A2-2]MDE1462175.1 hypothetical protein [Spartinivicinus sp. A2-2]